MTAMEHSLDGRVFVAIDIAKLSHDVLIEFPDGRRKRLKIRNSREDFERLLILIQEYPIKVAGLEPSGHYHRNLAYFLLSRGVDLKCISSIVVARTREALHNSWDKNDPKDAQVILYLLKAGLTQIFHDPSFSGTLDIQELAGAHRQVSLRRTKIQHSLINHYLTLYFPEAERFWHRNRAQWFPNLLFAFPTPQAVTSLSETNFIEQASLILKGRPNKLALLHDFYQCAKLSIGVPVASNSQAISMFRATMSEYQQLTSKLVALEETAHELLQTRQDYKALRTLPGIGPVIALHILAEAGDLKRFRHERQFLKFCGFDLSTSQSGQYRSQSVISKRGNARLRSVFWQAAKTAIHMKENTFKEKFKRYIARDPDNQDLRRKAYTATAAKMARVAYALIVNDKIYRPHFVEASQVE